MLSQQQGHVELVSSFMIFGILIVGIKEAMGQFCFTNLPTPSQVQECFVIGYPINMVERGLIPSCLLDDGLL